MKLLFHTFFLLISKIILGFMLGSIMLLFYASYSQAIRQEIKNSIQQMCKEKFDCHWDGQVESIDLLTLNITFRNVSFLPLDRSHSWSLYTDKFYVSASLFDLILYQRFNCHGFFEQVIIYEKQVNQQSHFAQVLAKIFFGQLPTQVNFNYMSVKDGQVVLQDASEDAQISYHYHCQMSSESDGLHTKLYFLDGSLKYQDQTIINNLFGNFVSIVPYNNDLQEIYARVDCRLMIPALQDKGSCFLLGDLYSGRGAFVLSNEDQSFIIEPLKIKLKPTSMPCNCSISIESELVQILVAQKIIDPDLKGTITLSCMGNLLDIYHTFEGKLEIQDVMYKNSSLLHDLVFDLVKQDSSYALKVSVDQQDWLQGVVALQEEDFSFDLQNVTPLQLLWNSYWNIPVHQGKFSGSICLPLLQIKGNYQADLESVKLEEKAQVKGSFLLNKEKLDCIGFFDNKDYVCSIAWLPVAHLVQLSYKSADETFIDLHHDQDVDQGTVGFVGFNFIKSCLLDSYKSSFSQPGQFDLHGHIDNGVYCAQIAADKAHIRIPSLYNVIQDFRAKATCNFIDRSLFFDQIIAHLYEGTVYCNHAVVQLDKQTSIDFLHIPLFLDGVLMNWNKGICGIVSGRLFLSKQHEKVSELQGHLMVDKGQLKGNIFSKEFQDQLVGVVGSSQTIDMDCNFDVSVETKEPIIVETSFLQAMVHLDLHLAGHVKQPEIEGSIDIASGELKFPYKSLFITHGQILIMPKRSADPTIEFIAKGKIKRYDITMRATGTVMDQQIHFESSPYLTEEQIISLLLTGSQDGSLSALMPAMFMQKLQEIVFGPAISKSKLDTVFNRLLQSFKNIRIFPQFTNQTGRGGVRGVVEIDATDRLQGRIDSNLMQLEDTIFEADYLVTDDVTLRAIKDGPSTYGGEVEMRWKFS